MNFKFQILAISKIDLQDRTYLFSYPKRNIFLSESIASLGLLQPPIVFKEKSSYKIICGEGRIIACKELGIKEIPVFLVKNLTPKELLSLSLESNLFRNLNLVEKAEFIEKALQIFSLDEILKILPKLGFSSSFYWIEFLKKIYQLEDLFKNLLIENKLNPKIVENLSKLDSEEKLEYLKIVQNLSLTFSEQKEVLEKLVDYKKRKDLPSLLPEELKEVLNEQDFNKRREKFFRILKSLFYPSYYIKFQKIYPTIKKFKDKQITVNLSPYFEEKKLEIQFKAFSFENLKEKIDFIIENKEDLKKVFEEI